MASIFLSYAREDKDCAERLARVLEAAGHRVWWDRHIESGSEFAAEIEAALDQADVVLVAWSHMAARSPWVRDEAAVGRDSGRLLPIVIDGTQPPIGFRQFQALDLTGWKNGKKDARTAALRSAVERRAKAKGKSELARPAAKPTPRQVLWTWRSRWAITAAIALVVAAGATFLVLRPGNLEAEPASLAVLPFKNLSSGEPYFAEGVAEEIANQLGREPQFKVAGRTSSEMFKYATDVRDVGRRLHVTYVLEGSVRAAGKQVRVDVSLVDARKGMRLWSQNFHGTLNDIFAIQDRIGRQVAANVKRELVARPLAEALVTSGEVYNYYVTARSLMRQREPDNIKKSIVLLKRALAIDPQYAPAWARLALASNLWEYYGTGGASTQKERVGYAERAVRLAPRYADGHAVLGLLLSYDDARNPASLRRGREELETAARLNPGDAESWYWLHYLRRNELDFAGALDAVGRSARIDPFFVLNIHYPHLAWDMGYRHEAIRFLKDRISNHPDPFVREMAQSALAGMNNDRSAVYAHAKKARDIASPDMRPIAEGVMGSTLLELQSLKEAEQFVPRPIVDLRRGKYTFETPVGQRFARAIEFWRFQEDPHLMPKALLKLGQAAELARLYDDAFSSPEDMALRMSKPAFVNLSPVLAISLQKKGRRHEGTRILLLAGRMCDMGTRGAHTPMSFRVSCSRAWSVMGRKELAIRTLEQAVKEGWRQSDADYPRVTEEPAYAVLRNEPRMRRIDEYIVAEFARERRELLAGGV